MVPPMGKAGRSGGRVGIIQSVLCSIVCSASHHEYDYA